MKTARHLTRAQLRELEQELLSERARLERAMAARTAGGPAATPDVAFGAPAQEAGGLAVALETRALGRHGSLVDALRRLEDGTYGSCLGCHGPIAYGRLLVMPEATHCMTCGSGG